MGRRRRRRRGFTLVELLVVAGVIVILVGLLLPALVGARRAGKQAVCASNMRQWGIALTAYVQANRGWLPRRGQGKMPTGTVTNYDDWFNALPGFLGQGSYRELVAGGRMPGVGERSVWMCPAFSGVANRFGLLFGYAMNMALSVRETARPDRINRVGPTATMVFMADGPAGFCSTVPFVSTPDAPAIFNPEARHNRRVNLSFLDGHVAAFEGKYVGIGARGDAGEKDACNRVDVRWYWYVPGVPPAPWVGP